MKHINTLDNSSLEGMMSDFEIRKAVELFSDLDSFLEKYRQCSLLVGNEDFVSFLEYLEIEENLRMGYLI